MPRFVPIAAIIAATTVASPLALAAPIAPGRSILLGVDQTMTDAALFNSIFTVGKLPTRSALRFGFRLRDNGKKAVIARAAVDSNGRLKVQVLDRSGKTLQTVNTGKSIRAGQKVYVEAEVAGGKSATVKVRAWRVGTSRPKWQLTRQSVDMGYTSGPTSRYAYLSRASKAADISSSNYWKRKGPYLDAWLSRGKRVTSGVVTNRRSFTFFTVGGECRVNKAAWKTCDTEFPVKNLPYGVNTVSVREAGSGGDGVTATLNIRPSSFGGYKPSTGIAGVPQGLSLKTMDGSEDGTNDGVLTIDARRNPKLANLDGKHIKARVIIKDGSVRITRSRITVPGPAPTRDYSVVRLDRNAPSSAKLTIEDSTLEWANTLRYNNPNTARITGLKGKNITANRIHVRNVSDAINMDRDNFTVQGSLIDDGFHSLDPRRSDGIAHDDGVQVSAGSNLKLIGNRITGYTSAAVMMTADAGDIRNMTIDRNWLNGGTCVINIDAKSRRISGLKITGNRMGPDQKAMRNVNTGKLGGTCASTKGLYGVMGATRGGTLSGDYTVRGNIEITKYGSIGQPAYILDTSRKKKIS